MKRLTARITAGMLLRYSTAQYSTDQCTVEHSTVQRNRVDAGNVVSMHSDTPVGPPLPLEWIWIAVNRIGLSGRVHGPGERVDVMQAMRMITIDAAYTLGVENKVGSIQPGEFADFTVLEQDPFEVAPMALRDIAVRGTVVGGRLQPVSAIRPEVGLGTR